MSPNAERRPWEGAVPNDQRPGGRGDQSESTAPAWSPGRIARERTRAYLRARAAAAGRRLLSREDEERHADRRRAGELARDWSVAE
ncbi:hypothetical protein [Pseudofrankia asymbiotica]|uniref:Uncharacterized protein n=1 Tax=Pseudofrankia asymbiotica TaxID=1834516 RepID=A0A1V2IMC6_9ACTN|nr:hypothetical protein [Pseudofrankia asymbiotica]ONH33636.1 hypothetical protein BL253_01055 [Pseudofrankia asymbiotica]